MAEQAVRPSSDRSGPRPGSRWRTVDIVVTAVLGVAFGIVFWAWGLLWAGLDAPFTAFPPAQAVMYGVWLLPAVLAPLIVRKPGAALFAELLAAIVSALLGSAWGTLVLVYWTTTWKVTYLVLVVVSTAAVAGAGGMALARALRASGALSSFGSGRTRV
jgi:energy-coupling factor transport system substrate-specific component